MAAWGGEGGKWTGESVRLSAVGRSCNRQTQGEGGWDFSRLGALATGQQQGNSPASDEGPRQAHKL